MTATLLLLLLPIVTPADPPTADAKIDGRTVAEWVADLRSEDSQKQSEAHQTLLKAGAKAKAAVPALTKYLGEKNARFYLAAEILGAIGPDAKEAVPALIALLPKEPKGIGYGSEVLAFALARIDGPKIEATRVLLLEYTKANVIFLRVSSTLHGYPAQVIPQLVTLCGDKDPKVRENAAAVLGALKEKEILKIPTKSPYEKAGDAVKVIPPALEKLLTDENKEVRLAAAKAITHVAPELAEKALAVIVQLHLSSTNFKKADIDASTAFQAVPGLAAKVLIPLFDNPDDRTHWWAVNNLASVSIREPVEDALKNGKTARIRQGAARTLGARYSNGVDSEPALIAALKDSEFVVRFAAAQSLVTLSGSSHTVSVEAIPVLIEGLQQKDENVRLEASLTLQMTGEVAKTAIPTLKKLLKDETPAVRREAALALVGIDATQAAEAVPVLSEGLNAPEQTAVRVAKALATLGPVAKDAIPELLKKLDSKTPHLQLFSAEAAARIDPAQAPKAVEVLVSLLQNKKYKSSMIREYSLVALQNIGPPAKSAMPALVPLLTDEGSFRAEVALAMLAIDPQGAKPALEWIRKAFSKFPDEDAHDLLERLPEFGAKAKPLLPDLIALLKAKTVFPRKQAIRTLGEIGPDAKDALAELKVIAEKDPRPDVRKLAAEAVKKIEKK